MAKLTEKTILNFLPPVMPDGHHLGHEKERTTKLGLAPGDKNFLNTPCAADAPNRFCFSPLSSSWVR
jgi:hypothetical protein